MTDSETQKVQQGLDSFQRKARRAELGLTASASYA